MITEDSYKFWATPPSATETAKMENAETAIMKAVKADPVLSGMDITVVSQGSYRSRTNVRQNSDVDFCIRLNSPFYPEYPPGRTKEDYGNTDGSISFSDFKKIVHHALGEYFGYENITPGNKAFDIHSNTYRIDADVVPAFAYRKYHPTYDDYVKPVGTCFITGEGKRIVNWPIQTYENGVAKHSRTSKRYKKMVRIMKKMRDKMQEAGIAAASNVGSFQLESMVWNVPDERFGNDTYTEDVRAVIIFCYNATKTDGIWADLTEVNGIKKIFGTHQPWSREQANAFFLEAWKFGGFK